MKKPKDMEAWGRATAAKRYAGGGGVDVEVSEGGNGSPISVSEEDTPLETQPADRTAEIDEFISRVMRDQIKKMGNE